MINLYLTGYVKLVIAFLVALSQSPVKTASANIAMLTLGDEISGMSLTTGATDAPPLSAFCSSEYSDGVTTADCWVPQLPALAIGQVFLPADHAFSKMEWSDLKWELYLDDKLIQLDDFVTYDYVLPTITTNRSPVREVFRKFTAWDVVLADLQTGEHTIEGRASSEVDEYRWIIHLVIEAKPGAYWQSIPKHEDRGAGSECALSAKGLSRFHGGCKFYG